jgi:cyclic-di-AMP phosphodiesterase PgpH
MNDFINKLYKNQAFFYKVFLFILTSVLIVYLMPKGGKFKYEITKGKPWQYENLYAPFDFAILKTDDEIVKEKDQIIDNHIPYFNYNEGIAETVKLNAQEQISEFFTDSILNRRKRAISEFVSNSLDHIYVNGVLREDYRVEDDQLFILKKAILHRKLLMIRYFPRMKFRNI